LCRRSLRRLQPYIFTLRLAKEGVNETAEECEQAVIPVADTKPAGE
jgi:hypothetical protein